MVNITETNRKPDAEFGNTTHDSVNTDAARIPRNFTFEISGGSLEYVSSFMQIDGEGGSADTLETITGGSSGDLLILESANTEITIADGVGNINLDGDTDKVISSAQAKLTLICRNGSSWDQISISQQ